jgi:hypothetical protein
MAGKLMQKILPWLLILAVGLSACAPAPAPNPTAQLSERYRMNHDYASLTALLPYLHQPMSRAEVEALLGKPYCDTSAQCFYPTEQKFLYCPAGYALQDGLCLAAADQVKAFELTWELVVYYTVQDYATQTPEDSLSGLDFMPVE